MHHALRLREYTAFDKKQAVAPERPSIHNGHRPMINNDRELSCYNTHLMLKYARRHNLHNVTSGLSVPVEVLDNPHEWTSARVWTELACRIEEELGGGPETLVKVTQEIYLHETNNFFPFLLKIAPMKAIMSSLPVITRRYSNKNLHLTFAELGKNKWIFRVRRLTPGHFSRQMCDFHKGAVTALLTIRGYQNISITETACAVRDGAPGCEYILEGTLTSSLFKRTRNALFYLFRDRNAIIRFMEQNHHELQKQYHEILSMRDFYSHIMDSMEEGIIWLNPDGTVTFANNAFLRLIGQPEREVIGKKFEQYLKGPHSTDTFAHLCGECRKMPSVPVEYEFHFNPAGDETRYGLTTVIWTAGEHFSPGYVISIRDITERKMIERQLSAAENRYRSLYENSPAIIVALDMNGYFLYANPAMTEQSGYTEDELKGMHFKDLIAPQADYDVSHLLKTLLDHPTRLQEVHFKTKDGNWKCVALNTYHIQNADGSLGGIAGIGVDVTETKRLNEQIIKSQRMDLLGQLAGGLAHDFGNILTSINGFSKMIAIKSTDDKIVHFAESIGRSGLRAHDLIKNLLAFSRGDSRRSVAFELTSLIQEVKEMLFGALPKNITVNVTIAEGRYLILGDPGKIHQCVLNLCMNARDAIAKESGSICLRLQRSEKKQDMIQIQVEDTGTGIPPDIIDNIFDPFFSTKEKKEGTGLGLSVVYGIIKSHKGEIFVESHPGEGTIFTLEFPAAPPPQPEQ